MLWYHPHCPHLRFLALFPLMLCRRVLVFLHEVSHAVICLCATLEYWHCISKLLRCPSNAPVSQFIYEIQDSWIIAGKAPEFLQRLSCTSEACLEGLCPPPPAMQPCHLANVLVPIWTFPPLKAPLDPDFQAEQPAVFTKVVFITNLLPDRGPRVSATRFRKLTA